MLVKGATGVIDHTLLSLQWRHNDYDSVSNHQPHGCLLKRLFRPRSKKTSKLRVTGLCVGNSPGPVNSPHKGPLLRGKCFHLMTSSCIISSWIPHIKIKSEWVKSADKSEQKYVVLQVVFISHKTWIASWQKFHRMPVIWFIIFNSVHSDLKNLCMNSRMTYVKLNYLRHIAKDSCHTPH